MESITFYNALIILSFNAVWHFIIGARNLGKTTAFKIRAYKRFMKKGRKTVWVRRFQKEKRKALPKMYNKKVCKILGIKPTDVMLKGDTWYAKKKGKFLPFLTVVVLSESNSERSADDPDVDTIVFDEFTTTPDRYARYRGNEVVDFIDLVSSEKRLNKVKIFLLGNNETFSNPYFSYFNIPLPELNFRGIRTYKKGSILLQVNNDLPDEVKESYDDKWNASLQGTPYFEYLNNGKGKFENNAKIAKIPRQAHLYLQADINGAFSVYACNGRLYVKRGVDSSKLVFVYEPLNKYKKERAIRVGDRQFFQSYITAYKYSLVYYVDAIAQELVFPFHKILGIN